MTDNSTSTVPKVVRRGLEPTADPQRIVDIMRFSRDRFTDKELHDFVRGCLRIARRQGRIEGAERRGVDLRRIEGRDAGRGVPER